MTWNEEFALPDQSCSVSHIQDYLKYILLNMEWQTELPDGSYSVSNNQDYFEDILKKYGEKTDNPSMKIYANKIQKQIYI